MEELGLEPRLSGFMIIVLSIRERSGLQRSTLMVSNVENILLLGEFMLNR